MGKIGVFLCQCGNNIAGMVDLDSILKELEADDELLVFNEAFLCSEAGQDKIKQSVMLLEQTTCMLAWRTSIRRREMKRS